MKTYITFTFLICCLVLSCNNQNREKPIDDSISTISENDNSAGDEKNALELLMERDYWVDFPVEYTYHFTGAIDEKYKYDMYLIVDSTSVSGSYNYLAHKGNINIEGTLKGNKLEITEEGDNKFIGIFDYDAGEISGTWSSKDGERVYNFKMSNPYGVGYPERTYKVHLEKGEYSIIYVKQIKLTYNDGSEEIIGLEDDVRALDFCYGLWVQDYNFDGYLDISLVWMLPAYPPLRYKYIFYEPETHEFVNDDLYDDIYTLVNFVDFRDKTVNLIVEGRHYSNSIYKYKNGKFYTIYQEYLTGDPGSGDDVEIAKSYFKIVGGSTVEIDEKESDRIYGY